jgi:hypothetical protein
MFITADQILLHLVGDYLLQNDWMAANKTKRLSAAFVHASIYSVPFCWVVSNAYGLLFIVITHAFIDRYRLSRYPLWARNYLSPKWIEETDDNGTVIGERRNLPWKDCSDTGFLPGKPVWLSTWLLIISDNIIHVILNGIAIKAF